MYSLPPQKKKWEWSSLSSIIFFQRVWLQYRLTTHRNQLSQTMKAKGLWQQISRIHQESHLFVAHVFCRSPGFFLRVKGKLNSSKNLAINLNSFRNRGQTDKPFLPKTHLKILLCLTPHNFTRQRETPWTAKG